MALWMDMTNSLRTWQGGVVGIIRAELEIAKNLKAINPELKISVAEGENGFSEISEEELSWLWNAESAAEAYIDAMGRKKENLKTDREKDMLDECVGLRNAYAYSDSRLMRLKQAAHIIKTESPAVLRPIESILGGIGYGVLKTGSVVRMRCKSAVERRRMKRNTINLKNKMEKRDFFYPFKENDTVLSVGWYTSSKERLFSKLKAKLDNFYLIYLVYDTILIKQGTTQFYQEGEEFRRYFEWITNNCDMVLYGGNTAKEDSESYQKENNLRVPQGDYIKFGTEIKKSTTIMDKKKVLEKYGVKEPYILTVGSIEPRKNHDVLYKAYSILADKNQVKSVPQLVIVGGEYGCENFRIAIRIDPKIKDKIKIIHPDDSELDVLYQNCSFTVLPTLYEGWSLTLPESLHYKKFPLVSDVKPLREVGQNYVDYVEPLNPVEWANKIVWYSNNKKELDAKEKFIRNNWKEITWKNCAEQINEKLSNSIRNQKQQTLYYDLTVVWYLSFSGAHVSGILRTVLILGRYLGHIFPQMKFFAISREKGYIEIDRSMIEQILGGNSIDNAFEQSRKNMIEAQGNKKTERIKNNYQMKNALWLLLSIMPQNIQKAAIDKKRIQTHNVSENCPINLQVPFKYNDVIFSAGTGYELSLYEEILRLKKQIGFKFVQLIYDFTPILLPQVHRKETIENYIPFLKYSSFISDVIFYGGETAMRDGIAYQKENKLPVREGRAIRFGSNIVTAKKENKQADKDILKSLGVTGPFIIAVGSIEVRKNHETLYQAYLRMLETGEELPQLIFVGYPGWKTEDLIRTICRDERIWDKLLIRTPSDEQLDVLYRHCLFTVLASHYEGWSLTLPESLNYGKFCIASKVDPLMEIGKDFIDYVHPWDVAGWAEKILYYFSHPEVLKEREAYIAKKWHAISWEECAKQVADELNYIMEERQCNGIKE